MLKLAQSNFQYGITFMIKNVFINKGEEKMGKKIILPFVYAGEWVWFYYVLILVSIFNLTYFSNIIFIDMPWEEPMTVTSSLIKTLLIVSGISIACFLYVKFLTGHRVYKKIKATIWGFLFASNALLSMLWFCVSFGLDWSIHTQIILLASIVASVFLTTQVYTKYLYNKKHEVKA